MPRAGHAGWGAGRRSGLQSITAAAPRVGVWGPCRLVRRSPSDITAGILWGNGVTDLLRWGGELLPTRSFRAVAKRVIDTSSALLNSTASSGFDLGRSAAGAISARPQRIAAYASIAVLLGTSAYCGVGYLKFKHLAGSDRTAAERAERAHLRGRINELEQKLSLSQPRQPSRPVAEAAPAAAAPAAVAFAPPPVLPSAPAAEQPRQVAVVMPSAPAAEAPRTAAAPMPAAPAVAAVDRGAFAQIERVLASTGVDVKHMFGQLGVERGLG